MKMQLGGNTQSSQGGQLEPGIHDVKFVSLINETIEKKDKSASFDVIKIKFEGTGDKTGKFYEHTVFEPRPGDDQRKANNFGGENPSNTEETGHLFSHLIEAVALTTAQELQKKGKVNLEGWANIKAFMLKATAKSGGILTQIKLLPNKDGRGVFPSFVLGLRKEKDENGNDTFPRTNFIGKNLTFTAKELKSINDKATAKPTNMSTSQPNDKSQSGISIEDDLDLDLDLV
jgi:hypothetical protein